MDECWVKKLIPSLKMVRPNDRFSFHEKISIRTVAWLDLKPAITDYDFLFCKAQKMTLSMLRSFVFSLRFLFVVLCLTKKNYFLLFGFLCHWRHISCHLWRVRKEEFFFFFFFLSFFFILFLSFFLSSFLFYSFSFFLSFILFFLFLSFFLLSVSSQWMCISIKSLKPSPSSWRNKNSNYSMQINVWIKAWNDRQVFKCRTIETMTLMPSCKQRLRR